MWDLNDSPSDHQRRDDESEGCSSQKTSVDGDDDKGKRVGSVSNSSSSAVVIEDGSEEEDGGRVIRKRGSSGSGNGNGNGGRIFGFPVTHEDGSDPPVTRQFFPVEDSSEMGGGVGLVAGAAGGFPRAHWVGVKFCQSSDPLAAGKSSVEASQPMKKSRRGPRSRSSQYRGVTFYRRTGRWESHIWLLFDLFTYTYTHTYIYNFSLQFFVSFLFLDIDLSNQSQFVFGFSLSF